MRAEQSSLRDKVQAALAVASMYGYHSASTASTKFSLQIRTLKLKMTKTQHLAYLLLQLKSLAQANMFSETSTQAALLEHTAEVDAVLDKYPALCSHIVLSVACLSFAHLCQHAGNFGVTAAESTISTLHKLLHMFVARRDGVENRQVSNVFWALAQLHVSPDDVGPSYETALAEMFLATIHESTIEGIGIIFWVMGMQNIKPLSGSLLDSIMKRLPVCLREPDIDCVRGMQVQSTHPALHICQRSCVVQCCAKHESL